MMPNLTSRIGAAITAATIFGSVLLILPSAALAQASQAAIATPAHNSRVEARIKSLHDSLHVTAAQEPQWQSVADVMRDNAKMTSALVKERTAKGQTMTAVDDLRSYEAIAEAHAAGVKKLTNAFETFYASLSDAQKKDADAVFRHRPRPSRPKKSG